MHGGLGAQGQPDALPLQTQGGLTRPSQPIWGSWPSMHETVHVKPEPRLGPPAPLTQQLGTQRLCETCTNRGRALKAQTMVVCLGGKGGAPAP